MTRFIVALTTLISIPACSQQVPTPTALATSSLTSQLTTWLTGDAADVQRATSGGSVLMGGSKDVDAALRWMIEKSGGGDFVVIRASGSDGYNDYIYTRLGGVNSVETILINSRIVANDAAVEQKIRNAEAIFIAGGDQANYVNYWKDTKVEDALNFLINSKKVPVGGTSAGCAILSEVYFSALNGTVTSADALLMPYTSAMTLGRADFLNLPFLANTVTDMHFSERDRQGRLIAFMGRMTTDWGIDARGIGVDERTAVCIESDGTARVMGTGTAYFCRPTATANGPEQCIMGQSLHWLRSRQAISVQAIQGTIAGTGTFNLTNWTPGVGSTEQYWFVNNGVFGSNP